MKKVRSIYILSVFILLLGGCKFDDLCYDHPHYPKTRINIDLSDVNKSFEDLQSFMVIFYPVDDGVLPLDLLRPTYHTIQSSQDYYVSLAPGQYKAVAYNNYSGKNLFSNRDDYENLYMDTATGLAGKYRGQATKVPYMREPDFLVADRMDSLTIQASGGGKGEVSGQVITFKPQRVTLDIHVEIVVKNLSSMMEYIGEVGELDGRFYMGAKRYDMGGFAIPVDVDNSRIVFDSNQKDGCIYLSMTSLGFTDRVSKSSDTNKANKAYLYVDFKLRDNSMFHVDPFDLTDMARNAEIVDGGITLGVGIDGSPYPPVVLPEVMGGGGIHTDVGNWGKEENVNVDL